MFTIKSKLAQSSGTAAAVLVLLIATLIVVYILFLPPSTRQALLEDKPTSDWEGSGATSPGGPIILSEAPGDIEPVTDGAIQHSIPAFGLFASTSATALSEVSSLSVKDSWFEKKTRTIPFDAPNNENMENILLGFKVLEAKGRLIIKFNGQEIYDNEVTSKNVEPIKLDKSLLKDSNVIEIMVSDVGINFWGVNKYTLSNVLITANVKDESHQISSQKFIASESEKNNARKITLSFIPECKKSTAGILDIMLNNVLIYSGVPQCDIRLPIEIDNTNIIAGQNNLVFSTKSGTYNIEQAVVESFLEGMTNPIYFFNINPQTFIDIENGYLAPFVYMQFPSTANIQSGVLAVNGRPTNFDTGVPTYRRNIAHLIQPGSNSLEIVPRKSMFIPKVEVVLERIG